VSAPLGVSPDRQRVLYVLGLSWRKQRIARRFLPEYTLRFVSRLGRVPPGATLAVWGMQAIAPSRNDLQVLRIEDGFLRSVGLGADLVQPLSWVVDTQGIYFDATKPSDLEHLLHSTAFTGDLLTRAAILRQRIVSLGITKYNVGHKKWRRPQSASHVILVPGQVESDASLAFGTTRVRTNLALLQAVRAAHPEAYIVYKPHPDVVAGLRRAGSNEHEASHWCDDIVTSVSLPDLFDQVDAVHVLTSLCGFEALLRDKAVTTYGQPFYAGWGLTTDRNPPLRRGRQLSIDALVAGALIQYPRYAPLRARASIPVEQALDELLAWRGRASPRSLRHLFMRPFLQLAALKHRRSNGTL
jgi:capsular polysaccharide export protein